MDSALYSYQLNSLNDMEHLESSRCILFNNSLINTNAGILADISGSGKTRTMAHLISRDLMPWFDTEDEDSDIESFLRINCTLVITHHRSIAQWEYDLDKLGIPVYVIDSERKCDNVDLDCFQVVLTTPSAYKHVYAYYMYNVWKRFIIDDVNYLDDVELVNMAEAEFYWVVSPFVNTLKYMLNICKLFNNVSRLMKREITGYDMFTCRDIVIRNIDYSCDLDIPYTTIFNYIFPDPNSRLITRKIVKKINEGDVETALFMLGIESATEYVNVFKRRLGCEFPNYESRISAIDTSMCIICLGKPAYPLIEPMCCNVFCTECIMQWLYKNSSCPMCREDINISSFIHVGETLQSMPMKESKLIDILNNNLDGKKFLIYVDNMQYLEPHCIAEVIQILDLNDIKYDCYLISLSGSSYNDFDVINSSNSSSVVSIVNYIYPGMDFSDITDIILYSIPSNHIFNMLMGKAERLGRTRNLKVHRFIYDG